MSQKDIVGPRLQIDVNNTLSSFGVPYASPDASVRQSIHADDHAAIGTVPTVSMVSNNPANATTAQYLTARTAAQNNLSRAMREYDDPVLPSVYTKYYLDPTATGTGTGLSAANAFTTPAAAKAVLAPGTATNLNKKALLVKRGSLITSQLYLPEIFSNPDFPFIIAPYGDSGELPIFDCGVSLTSWTQLAGTPLYKMAITNFYPVFHQLSSGFEVRYFNAYKGAAQTVAGSAGTGNATATALVTSLGEGYMYYGNDGYVYIYPFADNGTDLNLGQLKSSSTTTSAIYIQYNAQATYSITGNIFVHGMATRHVLDNGVKIGSGAGTPTNIGNLRVTGCDARYLGISVSDQVAGYAGDAVLVNGFNSTNRATDVYTGGNYAEGIGNNVVEFSFLDGSVHEFNIALDPIGHLYELWNANINNKMRFSAAHFSDRNYATGSANRVNSTVELAGVGTWSTNYSTSTTVDTTSLLNGGNEYAFNLINRCPGIGLLDTGSGLSNPNKYYNNTYICYGTAHIGDVNLSSLAAGTEYIISNNIFVALDAPSVRLFGAGTVATTTITGTTNLYFAPVAKNASSAFFTQNGVGNYSTMAAWQAVYTTADVGSQLRDPHIDSNGRPLPYSVAATGGTAITGYRSDLSGAALAAWPIGALQSSAG